MGNYGRTDPGERPSMPEMFSDGRRSPFGTDVEPKDGDDTVNDDTINHETITIHTERLPDPDRVIITRMRGSRVLGIPSIEALPPSQDAEN